MLTNQLTKYRGFIRDNGSFHATDREVSVESKVSPGVYKIQQNPTTGEIFLESIASNYDSLIDLPSKEYQKVVTQIDKFLTLEKKQLFNEYGFLYKRSFMLHGKPGTGKTCIVNRVSEKVIEKQGIVILNPNPVYLPMIFKQLQDIAPETLTMVIFEEFETLLQDYEQSLLNLLDGEIQKDNMIYVATTNFINKIPKRIVRPGRFPLVLEVGFPNEEAREVYLKAKKITGSELGSWVKKTSGLTIDEIKETIVELEEKQRKLIKR